MGTTDYGNLKTFLAEKKEMVDTFLESVFPQPEGYPSDLLSSMRYSLSAGGKRLRPILCLAGAGAVGGQEGTVLHVACALELIHTYSLIHDDLPVMDDDDLRRGKPTNHKIFGEAVALLAGDGLLTEAFSLMTKTKYQEWTTPELLIKAIRLISRAAGYEGMIGGQVVDIQCQQTTTGLDVVKYIHTHKTGALITSSVVSGAILGGGDTGQIQAMKTYGEKIGLAFQISDDILDIEGDTEVMGKQAGADMAMGKVTYPAVMGLEEARNIQEGLVKSAVESLNQFDQKADPLRWIARYIIERKK